MEAAGISNPPQGSRRAVQVLVQSGETLDQCNEFLALIAPCAGEVDQLAGSLDHGASLCGGGNGDAAPTTEVEQTLIS